MPPAAPRRDENRGFWLVADRYLQERVDNLLITIYRDALDRTRWAIRRLGWFTLALLAGVVVAGALLLILSEQRDLHDSLLVYVLVGFLAQLIDGALGMAYGVSSTTFLLSTGVPPAAASASVHAAGVVTTLASGVSHWKLGNVDRDLFKQLLLPGVLGGIAGAVIVTRLPADIIKPLVAFYLMLMGVRILVKALRAAPQTQAAIRRVFPLGLAGGFFDAIGGGGWGPIVTTSLMARGNDPRLTIGSVNLAEFFVTLVQSLTFVLVIRFDQFGMVILGLILGGVLAAPLAALVCRRLSARRLMLVVGLLIVVLSVRTLLLSV